MSYQQTIIIGNIGNDPELKYLQSGTPVCGFSVAVNETWIDSSTKEKREKVTWYRVSAWGKLGETCSTYLSKGRQVMVTGTVEARGYTNNAGEVAASLELRAREVRFLSGSGERSEAPTGDVNPDDIPF